jgi:drug/metabolite transporter (DMT)-like permease
MEYIWALWATQGGFGQALGWALKKKVLANKGINNTLGLVSYITAGLVFSVWWGIASNFSVPEITSRFVWASVVVCSLNVLAAWTAYKVLDQTALSKLLPFIALTSIPIVPIEYLIRGVFPTTLQLVGIVIVVLGAIVVGFKEKIGKDSLKVAKYFAVTLICYSITSPFMGVMVDESSSGLFSGAVMHLGIAFGFIPIVLYSKEKESIQALKISGEWKKNIFFMILTGVVIALLENGPINIALETAKASEVFALKRTMPFFALALGVWWFKERITFQHVIGTAFLVLGSVLVIWFR